MDEAIQMVKAYFDANDLCYNEEKEGTHLILFFEDPELIGRITVHLTFDENSVQIGIYNLCRLTGDNIDAAFEICSELNRKQRFVKYYVFREGMTVIVVTDTVYRLESCGEQAYKLMMELIRLARQAYPAIIEKLNGVE